MSFKEDLQFGKDSEERLRAAYPFLQYSEVRAYDFVLANTNIKIEKKCDSYNPAKYPNFIMERYSHTDKDGGPWQSKGHGVKYFMYWFVTTDQLYVFPLAKLIKRVESLIKKHNLKLFDRWNPGYTTRYYKVPISMLADLDVGMDTLAAVSKAGKKNKAAKRVSK